MQSSVFKDNILSLHNSKNSKPKIQQKSKDDIIKNINLFKLRKENKVIKDKIISDTRNFCELENKDYYKPIWVGDFF